MRKITLLIILFVAYSCSSDDDNCESERERLTEKFAEQTEQAKEHALNDDEFEFRRALLIEERDKKIAKARD